MDLISSIHNDLHKGALQLIAEHRARLYAEALGLCKNETDAEDLVIRTLDKAIRKIDTYSGSGDILSWMRSIMTNLHLNDNRAPVDRLTNVLEAETLEEYAEATNCTIDEVLRNSDSEVLHAALDHLDPEYKKVLVMHYFGELPVKNIALALNIPLGTVLWRLSVARRMLAKSLGPKLGKKPFAVLAAILLGVTTLFGAAVWGVVKAVNSEGPFASEGTLGSEETLGSLGSEGTLGMSADPVDPNPDPIVSNVPNPDPVVPTDPIPAEQISTTENNTKEGKTMNLKSIAKTATKLAVGAALTTGLAVSARGGDLYVAVGGEGDGSSGESPLGTIAAAIAAANAAIDCGEAQMTIHLAAGTYTERDLSVEKAISIVGEGETRGDVIVQVSETLRPADRSSERHRVFRLAHTQALLANMTMRHGWWVTRGSGVDSGANGGNVLIYGGGTITNCVLDSGYVEHTTDGQIQGALGGNLYIYGNGLAVDCDIKNGTIYNGNGAGGGGNVVLHGGGRLVRCRVMDGQRLNGGSPSHYSAQSGGSGVYMNGDCVVENCLIQGNSGSCGAISLFAGAPRLVNCTVVGNSNGYNGVNGVWVNTADARVVNCVIYGNGKMAAAEWGNANAASFVNCAVPEECVIGGGTDNVAATDFAFVDLASQDYRPAANGVYAVLVGSGTSAADYATYGGTSTTDLLGNPRWAAFDFDIGCYAVAQAPDNPLVVRGEGFAIACHRGETVAFSSSSNADDGDAVIYHWDFGDGETLDTADEQIAHRYDRAGRYLVTVTGSTEAKTSDLFEIGMVTVAPHDYYVAPGGVDEVGHGLTADDPFATLGFAFGQLDGQVRAGDPVIGDLTIHVAPGTYQGKNLNLSKDIRVVGEGATRTNVIVQAESDPQHYVSDARVFRLSDTKAVIANMTIRNGLFWAKGSGVDSGANGGNVLIYGGGMVTNCVLDSGHVEHSTDGLIQGALGGNLYIYGDGLAVDCDIKNGSIHNNNGAGGGGNVVLHGGGRLLRCAVRGARRLDPEARSYASLSGGSGLYINGPGIAESCLIADNQGAYGAVALAGAAKLVNCTVVANTVGYDVDGIICKDANPQVLNCAVYGNGGTPHLEWGGANGACYSFCGFAQDCVAGTDSSVIDSSAFVDFANGDYRVASGGALVNRGSERVAYSQAGAVSTTDLDANPRFNGRRLDIGCYELPLASGLMILIY